MYNRFLRNLRLRSLRTLRSPLTAIWLLGFGLRCLYLWQISHTPFFDLRLGDADAYDAWARRIAAGDWLGRTVFYQAPLYPYFLAIVYRLLGDSVTIVRIVQAFIGASSCALLASAAISIAGDKRAAVAGILLALYPPAIFLDGLLEKSCLVTFFTVALLALVVKRNWLAAGVALGLLTLTRENALLLIAPIAAWIAVRNVRPFEGREAAWFLGGCLLVLLPVATRNYAVSGEFHLTTSQFGPNFYIGNHAGASGSYEPLVVGHGSSADEQQDATRLAEQSTGRTLSAGEVSSFWTRRALDDMRARPMDWIRLMGRKTALTFNASEIADTESQDVYAEWSGVLHVLRPFDFGALLALAAMGAVFVGRRLRDLSIVYVVGTTYAASVILFYVFARYRFPLAPVLMTIASAGMVRAFQARDRQRDPKRVALRAVMSATAAFLALTISHIPLESTSAARATHYFAIGSALAKDPARTDQALEFYQRALREAPEFPAAQVGIGTLLTRDGRHDQAIPYFLVALQTWPDHAEAHYNLGLALAASGRHREAFEELAEAVRIRPDDGDARLALGKASLGAGQADTARDQYQYVLAREPKNVKALIGLGVALTQLGEPSQGIEKFEEALRLNPDEADAHNNLGWTLATQGRIEEAVPHFERAVALNPADANARRNLDQARALQRQKQK